MEGETAEVLQFQFGDWSPTGAYRNTTAFRVAAQQGQKRLMTHFFGVDEAVYDVQGAGDFVQNPQKYQCADDRPCDFHDVMIAQSLFGSSSFFGATCSRACPGVDTGEDMVDTGPCGANSTQIGVDKINLAGCRTECLADHRCNFMEHVTATSVCRLYADCAAAETADETADGRDRDGDHLAASRARARPGTHRLQRSRGLRNYRAVCVRLGAGTVSDAPAHRRENDFELHGAQFADRRAHHDARHHRVPRGELRENMPGLRSDPQEHGDGL